MNKKTVENENEKKLSERKYPCDEAEEIFNKVSALFGCFRNIVSEEDRLPGGEAVGLSLLMDDVIRDFKALVYGQEERE
ncbi:MAG: hypothetical protein MRK02_05595 [Candidatus Scalindua sp.]|nr:hypothetical protein [Candidatus Scalindua sp.]